MVHRDVKPANCLFLGGELKLGDFGLLTAASPTVSRLGTVRYMPPDGCMDARADVFAAGLVIYEMLTGLPAERFPSLGDRARGDRRRAAAGPAEPAGPAGVRPRPKPPFPRRPSDVGEPGRRRDEACQVVLRRQVGRAGGVYCAGRCAGRLLDASADGRRRELRHRAIRSDGLSRWATAPRGRRHSLPHSLHGSRPVAPGRTAWPFNGTRRAGLWMHRGSTARWMPAWSISPRIGRSPCGRRATRRRRTHRAKSATSGNSARICLSTVTSRTFKSSAKATNSQS